MAQKYYNMQQAAEVLGITPADVKKMLDDRKFYGYRDGADWKFKAEDIERLAKERAPQPADISDDDADVLLSEVELGQSGPGASGTVIGMEGGQKPAADSDIQLADSSVQLGEEAQPAAPVQKADRAQLDSKASQLEELDLTLEEDLTLEDSTVTSAAKAQAPAPTSDSAVDLTGKTLEDDDLVLGGSGAGSDVSIGGDSGISLVDPADSGLSLADPIDLGGGVEESLELDEDDMIAVPEAGAAGVKADDDFLLTPLEEASEGEDSESGSQVIALDTEGDEAATMIGGSATPSMAAMLDEDAGSEPMLGLAGVGALAGVAAAAGAMAGQPAGMAAGAAAMQPDFSLPETPYTPLNIAALAACAVLLIICGMFAYDLLRNMWSWDGPTSVNSPLMDTVLGWFGEK